MSTVPDFDVCGPLPTGMTVLEASAGTGKTFTIAALVARYVAADIPIQQLLVITFTRMATGELRERVRDRLVSAEHGVGRALAGATPDPDADPVLALLTDGDEEALELRRKRLRQAIADFDAATISTTHGFCQHVLGSLGVTGDVERDVTLLEDPADLLEEVVADLYVRKFAPGSRGPTLDLDEARRIARLAVDNPHAPIEPVGPARTTPEGMRRSLALAVRDELERRKRRLRVLTYDDLLTRLCATLADPARGPAAAARLRQRYRVALVDEFQDTDPVQWEIMARAFGHLAPAELGPPPADAALVLIGDPKQAIYAFRGADVHAYLDASRVAGVQATLAVSWRADQDLLDAYDALFAGAQLGHPEIAYRTVRAAAANQEARLRGAPDPAALRIRVVSREPGRALTRLTEKGFVSNAPGREHIAADLAADVVALLDAGATLADRPAGQDPAVQPGDIAVLVRTHKHAALVRDALDAVGVPAVINGAGSVFATPGAVAWLRLLEALERPTSAPRARAAALTPFLGWTAEDVALAGEGTWEDVHGRLHRWAELLRRRGVASLLEAITVAEGLPARLLARRDGERELTDLRHLGQLLHAAAVGEQLGVAALTAWLRRRIAEAAGDVGAEERSRRLESDVAAVQVLTIHRSKGLEFPVVYYPDLWEPGYLGGDRDPAVFHDPATGRRTLDVGMTGRDFAHHRQRDVEEQRGEELRLAYVALTRAKHQAVVWWAGSWDSRESVLCRLLFDRDGDGSVGLGLDRPPEDADVLDRLDELAAAVPGCISITPTAGGDGRTWSPPAPAAGPLAAARIDRGVDTVWRRSSYSAITAGGHEPRVASEVEEPEREDEAMPGLGPPPPARPEEAAAEAALRAVALPLADLPGGAAVGTHLHRVLEAVDFAAEDLPAEVAARLAEQRARRHVDVGAPRRAADGLVAALTTPLGPLAGGRALRDVRRTDRLDELWFELPVVGGDAPTGTLEVAAIAALLTEHLPAGDPLAGYGERLAEAAPTLQGRLRGYLTGALDLVLRLPAEDGSPRFVVADHKSNWLGVEGEALTAWHYRPAALAEAMQRAHYPLQALLYSVALHRYLRWRLPGYDPGADLGGVLYLFLRGMAGPEAPLVDGQPCGVFAWAPPPALVTGLSDLLDTGGSR